MRSKYPGRVVDAEDGGAAAQSQAVGQACEQQGFRTRSQFPDGDRSVRGLRQQAEEHTLSRKTDQDGTIMRKLVKMSKQCPVLPKRLTETKTGIQPPFTNAGILRLPGKSLAPTAHGRHDVISGS